MEASGLRDPMLRKLSSEVSLMSLRCSEFSGAGLGSVNSRLVLEILLADPLLVLQSGGLNDNTKELTLESVPLVRREGLNSPGSLGEVLVSDSVT